MVPAAPGAGPAGAPGRQGTAHAALIAEILGLLSGNTPALPPAGPHPLDPLSKSEIRVLRYLPTHLSAPEIAGELYVSPTTVKTYLRNLYAKLGVHSRTDAVEAARALGLLAPSGRRGLTVAGIIRIVGWPLTLSASRLVDEESPD